MSRLDAARPDRDRGRVRSRHTADASADERRTGESVGDVAWWAANWTPLQPSPAAEPLPWLPNEEASADARVTERNRDDALARRSAEHGASNLPTLNADERRARAAALRALLLARQRRFDAAELAFREAAELDPALDLSLVTTFWDLERGGHEAAIRASETLGRMQDARWLRARVETRYRPRLVRSA